MYPSDGGLAVSGGPAVPPQRSALTLRTPLHPYPVDHSASPWRCTSKMKTAAPFWWNGSRLRSGLR
jgi:hypothetical protein